MNSYYNRIRELVFEESLKEAGREFGEFECDESYFGAKRVLYGYYAMADGAVLVAKAEEGVKAMSGVFFLNLLCPVAGTTNGIPVVVDYNMSPFPAGRYR